MIESTLYNNNQKIFVYDKKIRVSLVYKKSYNYFQSDHFDQTSYDFFFKALKRNNQLEISYYPCEKKFDSDGFDYTNQFSIYEIKYEKMI